MNGGHTLFWLYDWFGRFLDHDTTADSPIFRPVPIARGGVPGLALSGLANRGAAGQDVALVKHISAPMPLPALSTEATGTGALALRATDAAGPYARLNGGILGATPEGVLLFDRPHIQAWEFFAALTPAEALGLDLLCQDGLLELTRDTGARVGPARHAGEFCLELDGARVAVLSCLEDLARLGHLAVGGACDLVLPLRDGGTLSLTCKKVA